MEKRQLFNGGNGIKVALNSEFLVHKIKEDFTVPL